MKAMNMPPSNQTSRTNERNTNKKTEPAKKHENDKEHKSNSCKFSWSTNELGRECKGPLSNSRDWNGTNSRMNNETNNDGESELAAGKDAD